MNLKKKCQEFFLTKLFFQLKYQPIGKICYQKLDKTEDGQTRKSSLNYLRYRDSKQLIIDSKQLIIYTDCNRIEGFLD